MKSVIALTIILASLVNTPANAALSFLKIPSIAGEDPTPGYPGAMAVETASFNPSEFAIVKKVDVASPAISNAVISGTPLGTSQLLFYNTAPAGPPDAILPFPNVYGTGYQLLGGGGTPTEKDTFASTEPAAMFLEVPGITGESSTPGHAGIIAIESFSLTGNAFSVVKLVDTASPAIVLAVTTGTHLPTASLLIYNDLVPAGPPNATIVFHDLFASGYQALGGGNPAREEDTFSFATLSQPVPEPGALVLATIAASVISCARRRVPLALPVHCAFKSDRDIRMASRE